MVLVNLLKVLALLPVFLFLSALVFYVPGDLLISQAKLKLRDDEEITLAISLGLVIFLIIAVLTALIDTRILSPFILLLINLYAFSQHKTKILKPFLSLFKQKTLMVLLLLGTLVEGFINFPSSFPFQNGHLYWSAQGHDGLWHVAVIEAIKKYFPVPNPLYAGKTLYNYHYFVDFIMAEFSRIFSFFPTLDLYYRLFPFLISFLIGLAAYSFLTTWQNNKKIGLLGIFFTYFVGSFGYLVLLIQGRGLWGGETTFWAAQGNTIIGNPPHAFCYILLPTFFLSLYYFLKQKKKLFFIICFLLGGFLAGFKVSAGFILVVGLGAASFFSLILRKNQAILGLTALVGLANLAVFKSITRGGVSFLIFEPWWFIRTMIVAPDRLNWVDLEHRRQFYLARGGIRSLLRVFQFEATAFLIFLTGNLGMRVIGFWEIFKRLIRRSFFLNPLETTIFFALLTSFLVPLFFIQKGVVYNLIQFMQYFLLIFGFFAAISLYHLLQPFKKKAKKYLVMGIFVALSIPTVIGNLSEFYGKNPLAIISYQEIEALNFLKTICQENDVFLTKPFNKNSQYQYEHQPFPIYAWESTAYVSAYTGQQSYLTDEGQVKILGIDSDERIEKMVRFFEADPMLEKISLNEKREFLEKEGIDFIYLRKDELDPEQIETYPELGLKEIFNNEEVVIYQAD